MGLLLARPHTWPPALRFRSVTHLLDRVLPRGSINYILTYMSLTSGVGASSSGGSSDITTWPSSLSAYRSYTGVAWYSGKSLVIVAGTRYAIILVTNWRLCSLCTGMSISLRVKVRRVDHGKTLPFLFNILAHMAGPTSSVGPKYRPCTILFLGYET